MPMEGCHEELEYHVLDVDFTIPDNFSSSYYSTSNISLFLIDVNLSGNLYADGILDNIAFRDIKPPPKLADLIVLFHSFLI